MASRQIEEYCCGHLKVVTMLNPAHVIHVYKLQYDLQYIAYPIWSMHT